MSNVTRVYEGLSQDRELVERCAAWLYGWSANVLTPMWSDLPREVKDRWRRQARGVLGLIDGSLSTFRGDPAREG